MAAGVPVIAASVGGVAEVLEDGVNARLVPPGDVDRLAAALDRSGHRSGKHYPPVARAPAAAAHHARRRARLPGSLCLAEGRPVAAVKQGLLTVGHYRRALAQTTFPGVAVLGYHGVRADDLPAGAMAFENLHVRASTFDAHCRVIRECCDPITLDDWREAAAGAAALPPRPVLITFDDGYRSVLRGSARRSWPPIDLPAVVFVCTDPIANAGGCSGSTPWRRATERPRSSAGRRATTTLVGRVRRLTRRSTMTIRGR